MADSPRVCFVTPGHIASNPRLVKEASAASQAGYAVRVVFSQYMNELAPVDDAILSMHPEWAHDVVVWRNDPTGRPLRRRSALRQHASAAAFRALRLPAIGNRSLNRIYDELLGAASRERADLYVAHNLAALPVAVAAAERRNARATFDAEDFHRGDLEHSRKPGGNRRLIEWAESRYLPQVAAISAASDGIGNAYAQSLGLTAPTTILNVFEQDERTTHVPSEILNAEREDHGRSVYWFSQTIGPNRGLESAIDALAFLPDDVHFYLRGMWAAGYEATLRARAAARGVAARLHHRASALPHHLVRLAACHDVGLALELPLNANKQVCVSNKLFTYLLAGVPVALSATDGQRDVARDFLDAVRLYSPGDAAELAGAIRELLDDSTARHAALSAALSRYSWDIEKGRFLRMIGSLVGPARAAEPVHA